MKSFVNNSVYALLSRLRLAQICHKAFAGNTLSILAYHGLLDSTLPVFDWCFLDGSSFLQQIMYLRNHFKVVHLSKAIELLANREIDTPTVAITFDDGFQSSYDIAFPILSDTGTPATIFLTTEFVDTDDTLWFCRVNHALGKTSTSRLDWNGSIFNLGSPREKSKASARIQIMLKDRSHTELLEEVRKIVSRLGDDPDCPISIGSPYRMLSSSAVMEMLQSGLIEFGAHSHTHAILSSLSLEDKEKEILHSVRRVEQLTGRSCELFSYPNGRFEDYDDTSINILKSRGVHAAVTMIPGPNTHSTPVMHLRRYGIGGNLDLPKFQAIPHHLIWKCKSALRMDASSF